MSEQLSESGFEIQYLPIKVNEKILLHIGRGIYPSVAGVIKELVHNAFDADAEQVVISTGYPYFEEIRVFDTGHGMSLERFKMALTSVGNSMKDTIDQRRTTKKYKRPIIGRLGIGLMALSQICDKAIIESQEPGTTSKFSAVIDFSRFRQKGLERTSLSVLSSYYGGIEVLRRQLEEEGLEPEQREELKLRLKLAVEADEVRQEKGFDLEKGHLGYCTFIADLPALPYTPGTLVILLGIRPEIKAALMNSGGRFPRAAHLEQQNGADMPYDDWDEYLSQIHWSWRDICEKLRIAKDGLTYEALPGYHQFLYQLAQMSPVPYFPDGPISIQPEILRRKKEELKRFNFSLRVDNRLLYKPTLLPSGALTSQDELKMGDNYLTRQIQFNDVLADGTHLRYHGYLYWQKAENKPTPLHGIQIYICNVGIGLYDETLLNYSKVERNSRTGQISGEIYVEEGLEQALNVDRRSFRETDLHYVTLQQHIWKEIGVILQQSVEADKRRKQIESATSYEQHVATLEQLLSAATNGKMALAVASDKTGQAMEVNDKKLVFNLESNKWSGTQSERLLGQKILLTMRAALATGASGQEALGLVEALLLK
ncbi:MAG: ATP-binding protein [Ardenticatenaceae bacterium]